jgi:ABC-type uncharacterized transport system permease subunit
MSATDILDNPAVRLGALPVAALVLTSVIKRLSIPTGLPRYQPLSRETFNVGLELSVLAALTALTTLVERARTLASMNDSRSKAEHSHAAQSFIDESTKRIEKLSDHQLTTSLLLVLSVIVAFMLADWTSRKGYDSPNPGTRRSARTTAKISLKGVLVPILWAMTVFVAVLTTSE